MISSEDAFLLLDKFMTEAAALEMLFLSSDDTVKIKCAVSVTALREPTGIELVQREREHLSLWT